MKNTLETRLGIFFAFALIAGVIILELIGAADFFKKGYRVTASFRSAQELKKGDAVKMAGVSVGEVEGISLTNGFARVTMKITSAEAEIKTDSRAAIKFTGLMGQNFVAIDFGSPTNQLHATEGTALLSYEQPDLSSLMVKLEGVASGVEGLTKSFSTENLSGLLGPVTDFVRNNNEKLSGIISNFKTVSDNIAQGKGTVGRLINDESLFTTAMGAVGKIDATLGDVQLLLGNAQKTVANINAGQGTLGLLLKDDAVYRESATAMKNLREIMEKINHGQGSVGKLVNDESFFKNIKLTLQKVEKATEGIEDQGPLSVLGIAVNKLF
ncbi:MAG TPA: MCE family protein [Verrucomicrobiales bacterium]|nr:MCE family protein [Verrucomicrobiales bacterium]